MFETSPVNKKLAKLLQQATRRRAEATLPELFETFELNENSGTLANVFTVNKELSDLGLRLIPGIDQGELETVRRVELIEQPPVTEIQVLEDLKCREAAELELKSSLLYDHQRAKNDPNATVSDLKSEAVLYASLRTIAAFLTCRGGILYVGADDDGKVLGIEYDFPCLTDKKDKQNADGWQLHLRNRVQTCFKDGNSINDYISCILICIAGKLIARVEVSPRTKLSFLVKGGDSYLYRRQGNRTTEVPIDLLEEFIDFRRTLRN
jgi:hypothetical protein